MKTYKNLAEALLDCPKSDEEYMERLRQENSETSETPNTEQQEPILKFIVRLGPPLPKKGQPPKEPQEEK